VKLYQFALSHYCEKVRWALDYKGLKYEKINLVPGPHLLTIKKMAPQTSVPVLVDEGKVIQDSTKILDYLDQQYPEKLLTPTDANLKKEALALEEYFDQEIGVQLRRFFYFYILPDSKLAISLLLQRAPSYGKPLYTIAFPLVRKMMRINMRIDAAHAEKSRKLLEEALEGLNKGVIGKKFLLGDRLSRADITAASLLAPLCMPPEHEFPWPAISQMPQALQEFRKVHEADPFFKWVLDLYQQSRTT